MDQWLVTKQMPVHLIAACGLVMRDGKVLLLRSKRRGWEFPGHPLSSLKMLHPETRPPHTLSSRSSCFVERVCGGLVSSGTEDLRRKFEVGWVLCGLRRWCMAGLGYALFTCRLLSMHVSEGKWTFSVFSCCLVIECPYRRKRA